MMMMTKFTVKIKAGMNEGNKGKKYRLMNESCVR